MVKPIRSLIQLFSSLETSLLGRPDSLLLSGQVLARCQNDCHLGLSFTIIPGTSFFLS